MSLALESTADDDGTVRAGSGFVGQIHVSLTLYCSLFYLKTSRADIRQFYSDLLNTVKALGGDVTHCIVLREDFVYIYLYFAWRKLHKSVLCLLQLHF